MPMRCLDFPLGTSPMRACARARTASLSLPALLHSRTTHLHASRALSAVLLKVIAPRLLLAAFSGIYICVPACSEENPFALPSDEEIFMLQEDEKRRRSEQIRAMRSLPVYMKSTFSSQIQATVARDAGTTNAQRRPMGVDPVRYGAIMHAAL